MMISLFVDDSNDFEHSVVQRSVAGVAIFSVASRNSDVSAKKRCSFSTCTAKKSVRRGIVPGMAGQIDVKLFTGKI